MLWVDTEWPKGRGEFPMLISSWWRCLKKIQEFAQPVTSMSLDLGVRCHALRDQTVLRRERWHCTTLLYDMSARRQVIPFQIKNFDYKSWFTRCSIAWCELKRWVALDFYSAVALHCGVVVGRYTTGIDVIYFIGLCGTVRKVVLASAGHASEHRVGRYSWKERQSRLATAAEQALAYQSTENHIYRYAIMQQYSKKITRPFWLYDQTPFQNHIASC